jgi:magnesium-transporting ATPase (P-type)
MTEKRNSGSTPHVAGQSNKPMTRPAHALSHEDVTKELKTDSLDGLSNDEAAKRLQDYGKNELGETESVQPMKIIIAQIANAMTLVSHTSATPTRLAFLLLSPSRECPF